MAIGSMWMSGMVAQRFLEFKSHGGKMTTVWQKVEDAIEIVDLDEESEKDSPEFKKMVKKVYNILKVAEGKWPQTNIKHFGAYIIWRLENGSGDTWHPTKLKPSTVRDMGHYSEWLVKVGFAQTHLEDVIQKGNAEYWLNCLKKNRQESVMTQILSILPMCSKVLMRNEKAKPVIKKKNPNSEPKVSAVVVAGKDNSSENATVVKSPEDVVASKASDDGDVTESEQSTSVDKGK